MKTKHFFLAALAIMFASCANDQFVGDNSPTIVAENAEGGEINFGFNVQNSTRAGEFVGATAAEKLGGMFVVEGTKGTEQTNSPSTTVVFDNYLVGYTANTAGTTESNSHNWEYVGLQTGITSPLRMSAATWGELHPSGSGVATTQSVKYWDYTQDQYDFIAWSTGKREAVTVAPTKNSTVQVTRINTGTTLASNGFKMTALSAEDLMECYYTDIKTVLKANYGSPVTLTFRNMAAKVRIALYETIPGYSVKDVYFYTSDANPISPADLGYATTNTLAAATLFTMGDGVSLPQSGEVTVMYPHMGTTHRGTAPGFTDQTKDYNKASVTVTAAGGDVSTTQAFGALTAQYRDQTGSEPTGKYLGMTLPTATFAGDATKDFYTAVIPNTNAVPLTLRVDYTLVATDGSNEEIHVYGAKAVVPATYTVWQPNYAYTYIFKIADNSNGYTSTSSGDPQGLFPITFDAVVTSFTDANAEQTTVTTVASPSITTYQQGHTNGTNEYDNDQTAGVSADVKPLYVQVMDNSSTPALVATLSNTNSLLYKITKGSVDYVASEAEVMDALQNRTNEWNSVDPRGRNGLLLTKDADNINNSATTIVNGVDDQPITGIAAGKLAEIDIKDLAAGTYAYVYCTTVPSTDEKVYHVAAATSENFTNYYPVSLTLSETVKAAGSKATAGYVYFVPNKDAKGTVVSYTFKQTKVNDDVEGLVEKVIPADKATAGTYDASIFYFDVYNQNNGAYAVKVIKVVD